jgi:hypothetical protein
LAEGLGPKVAGAAAGVGEHRSSMGELAYVAAVSDGDQSELPAGRQQQIRATPTRRRPEAARHTVDDAVEVLRCRWLSDRCCVLTEGAEANECVGVKVLK